MISLHCSASPFQTTLGLHHLNRGAVSPATTVFKLGFTTPPIASNFRINGIRLQVRRRLLRLSASNTNSSDEDSQEESEGRKTGDATQGPPFLTILAGFLVLLVVAWVIGSVVLWLIGLIVHPPSSK